MTRVVVVDDHPMFLSGLVGLLHTLDGTEVVGTAGDGAEALDVVARERPDVVLMDLNLPRLSGIEATRRITATNPGVAVLVVTMVDDDDTVFAALTAGACGYVLKGATQEELRGALQAVASGGAVFGSQIARRVLDRMAPRTVTTPLPDDVALTPREAQVLALLARGLSNARIAQSLQLSLKTVQNHVSRILDKMRVSDRTQAALLARGLHREE